LALGLLLQAVEGRVARGRAGGRGEVKKERKEEM